MRPSHRGSGLWSCGCWTPAGPSRMRSGASGASPGVRDSRPRTCSTPPRAVRTLTPSGLLATAKFVPRRAWTAGSRGGGRVPALCPRPLDSNLPPPPRSGTSSSGAQRETARPAGSLLSPPRASWPDLPKSPPVGARPAAWRPVPLTPGRVFCSCSALWAFSADSRSQ